MIKSYKKPIVFCDVETTGLGARYGKITDIACIRYENGKEVSRVVSLINPEMPIPYNIQMLTGITDEIVKSAPLFVDISPEIEEIFKDAVLCAHNAKFDLSFIKKEMREVGYDFSPTIICTAEMSRRLFKEYNSHNLSAIIDRYNFTCVGRHTALGDTEVLVQFAKYIEKKKKPLAILEAINKKVRLASLPPNIDPEVVDNLPNCPGVYSFFGKNGELLYVGKSVDIKKRVQSHFTNSAENKRTKRLWE